MWAARGNTSNSSRDTTQLCIGDSLVEVLVSDELIETFKSVKKSRTSKHDTTYYVLQYHGIHESRLVYTQGWVQIV